MKPAFIVTLDFHSRHAQPNIGDFKYSDKHKRHVWKGKDITDISELARCVNEAFLFQRQMNFMELVVEVLPIACEESETEEEAIIPPASVPEATIPDLSKRKPGRPPARIFTLEPTAP